MDILLALLLLAAALAALAYPLYTARPQAQLISAAALNDLLALRDGLYATLRDLDLDYQLGKLDAADYSARREKYLARAAVVLQQVDALRGAAAAQDDEIEKEVAALRKAAASSKQSAVSSDQPALRGRRSELKCPNCGRAVQRGDKFCARCGEALA